MLICRWAAGALSGARDICHRLLSAASHRPSLLLHVSYWLLFNRGVNQYVQSYAPQRNLFEHRGPPVYDSVLEAYQPLYVQAY